MNSATLTQTGTTTEARETAAPRNRLKLIRKVSLRFFEDDANGEWGLTHEDTTVGGSNGDDGFNAFWDGRGIFHDLFEHSHEHVDPYFRGDYAMNVGGEVAAMGALWYYYNTCGMSGRLINSYFGYETMSGSENTIRTTLDLMHEAIESGYYPYGYTLESGVPRQKETDNGELECIIASHFERIQELDPSKAGSDENAVQFGQAYKDSVTLAKLEDLYRYGYRMAEKLLPEGLYQNGDIMTEFCQYWTALCKANSADECGGYYKGIEFSLYRDSEGLLNWKAVFVPQYGNGVNPVTLRGGPNGVPKYVHILP